MEKRNTKQDEKQPVKRETEKRFAQPLFGLEPEEFQREFGSGETGRETGLEEEEEKKADG